jgi:hypothetical protein
MIRVSLVLRSIVALALCLPAAALCLSSAARAQVGFDRHGSDYTSFVVRTGDPALCAARCDRDIHCRAWSFSYPSGDRPAACWLKNQVPPRIEDLASASGVRGAGVIQPRRSALEFSIDRPGGDYRSFDVAADAAGDACKDACDGESQCRAWTYVRPGYDAPQAQCHLKDHLMPPRHKPCCISGVVR